MTKTTTLKRIRDRNLKSIINEFISYASFIIRHYENEYDESIINECITNSIWYHIDYYTTPKNTKILVQWIIKNHYDNEIPLLYKDKYKSHIEHFLVEAYIKKYYYHYICYKSNVKI